MAVRGSAALVGWFDHVDEAEMNEWQAREHVHERVGLPGFIRHRRFASPDARPRNLTLVEVDDMGALKSAQYLERLNDPTEWSRKCSPGLRNMRRSVCRITATFGSVDGGTAATLELAPRDPSELRSWLSSHVLPEVLARRGVYAAHLLETDRALSQIETVEKKLRPGADVIADWVIVLEGLDPSSVASAAQKIIDPKALLDHGASDVATMQIYRLSFAATRAG